MFKFKYKIVTTMAVPGGAEGGRTREIVEGQADRSENNLQSHYFNCFRSVYSGFGSARFRGWATPYGKAAGQNFMRTYVHDLARGVVGLRELFDMFEELHKDLHATSPPVPPRLFRLTPFYGGPVARAVETEVSTPRLERA